MKGGDASAFRKFHNLLIKCQNLSTTLERNALDNPDTICNLLTKLPVYLRDKWNRKVFVIRKSFREPTFCDFVEFIDDESTLVCDPLFSRNAIDKFSGIEYKKKKLKNFAIKSSNSRLSGGDYRNKEAVKCHLCDGYHDLDECDEYLKKPVEERSKFLAQKKLCYGCYDQINANHKARNCTKRRRCKICQRNHPSGLHGYRINNQTNSTSQGGNTFGDTVNSRLTGMKNFETFSMCVVPVGPSIKIALFPVTRMRIFSLNRAADFIFFWLVIQINIRIFFSGVNIKIHLGGRNFFFFSDFLYISLFFRSSAQPFIRSVYSFFCFL